MHIKKEKALDALTDLILALTDSIQASSKSLGDVKDLKAAAAPKEKKAEKAEKPKAAEAPIVDGDKKTVTASEAEKAEFAQVDLTTRNFMKRFATSKPIGLPRVKAILKEKFGSEGSKLADLNTSEKRKEYLDILGKEIAIVDAGGKGLEFYEVDANTCTLKAAATAGSDLGV